MSNFLNEEVDEDILIAKSFVEDGHNVCITGINYDEKLEDVYDIFIKRNTWFEDEAKMAKYMIESDAVAERLSAKGKRRVNFNGNFDRNGKNYLAELYKKGFQVVPTVNNLNDIGKLDTDLYILKPKDGYDGFGQQKVTEKELKEKFNKSYVIQPAVDFQSEVQFYFVGTKAQYALEFKPSKIPIYPTPTIYDFSEKELALAQSFANLNKSLVGVQRIDFLKLKDGRLLLLEIEDYAPHLELTSVNKKLQDRFLKDYKDLVYSCKE
jgi:hypothetical protein